MVWICIMSRSVCCSDECELGIDNCSRRRVCVEHGNGRYRWRECTRVAMCIDTVLGFECSCAPGFMGDGVTCEGGWGGWVMYSITFPSVVCFIPQTNSFPDCCCN